MKIQVHLYKYPLTTREVDSSLGCPACNAVHEFGAGPGVYFIVANEALYRTEQLDDEGQVMFCKTVTEQQADDELALQDN